MTVLLIIAGLFALFLIFMGIAMAVFNSFLKIVRTDCKPCEKTVGSGLKKALIIYHPSMHRSCEIITDAIAGVLAENDYTVTVNRPYEKLTYNVSDYDILIYGTSVYCGQPSTPLKEFVRRHSVSGKKILVYSVGMAANECPELNIITDPIPDDNYVVRKKLCPGQIDIAKKWVETELNGGINEVQ